MLKRNALCVGIDQYQHFPSATLHGCVNDARTMAALLKDLLGFEESDITLLTDQAATKVAILTELKRMVEGALAGRYDHLVFSFAGHGTLVPDLNLEDWDRADEAFCPYDLATSGPQWDRDHLIVDDELHDLLVQLPAHVLLEVYLDTSHGGSGLLALDMLMDRQPRFLPPPSTEAYRDLEYRRARPAHQKLLEKGLSHHVLWTACKEGQTAASCLLGDEWHGAFTWYFSQEVRASANHDSRAKLLAKVRLDLRTRHFTQVPVVDCGDLTRHALLRIDEIPAGVMPLPTEMPS
ncbi:MAG: caspase family protein [Holophagaceae bacterium]|uniref:Caspase family protein n=1 Tax=Candidatus Geothrix skivensis TaxID=2954439 RepID=A0A9D7SH98_9BACT|nr:caspase family protein [Candidatus Geothrix skivensis]